MSKKKRKHSTPEKKKHKDLQPWLDYFDMLRANVEPGFLQMSVVKHEAFVAQPGIHAMSEGDDPAKQIENGSLLQTAHRIFTYAAWLSGEGNGYRHKPFAVHVVKDTEPHDMIYTILFTSVFRFFRWKEKVEVINYPSK